MASLPAALRTLLLRPSLYSTPTTSSPGLLSLLLPSLQHTQTRHASILGSLSDNPGAYNKRIRRGRGPASGKGKTSGRGHKGQKQHGKVPAGFTGGQTPLEVVKGVRGFENQFSVDMTPINLDRIQSWIEQGRLDTSRPITVKELQDSRCTHGIKDGVKLLCRTTTPLTHAIHITVSRASASAIAAVEAAGGSVQTRYYTRPAIRRILRNETHPTLSLMSPPTGTTLWLQSTSDATTIPPSAADSPTTHASETEATANTVDASTETTATGQAASSGPLNNLYRAFPSPSQYRYRLPDPSSRKDLEYYRDPAHRGYLSYQVEAGAGPSLFFRTPGQVRVGGEKVRRKVGGKVGGAAKGEGRLF